MAKKTKQDKRRERARAKAKTRAGSPIPENRPGYRNPEKALRKAAEAQRRRAVEEANARRDARQCGDCTACCTVLGIPSLKKPAWTPCAQLCGSGCGVYDARPRECADYLCGWRQGLGDEDDRPDKLGVVIDLEKGAAIAQVAQGQRVPPDRAYVAMMREAVEGGFEREAVKAQVKRFADGGTSVALVHGREGITVYGPKHPDGIYLSREVMDASNERVAKKKGLAPKPSYRDDGIGDATVVEVPEDLRED